MDYSQVGVGSRIKEQRKQKGLNQTELANLLTKSLRTIQKYESGEIEISIAMINELAEKLDTTSTYLIGYDPNKIHIESLSDICEFLFKLEKKDGIKFDIDVKKPKSDGEWKCSITFDGQDTKTEHNSTVCLFLEEYANYREKHESYLITKETYEEWQNKDLAYYAPIGLKDKVEEELDEITRLERKNKFLQEQFKTEN